MLIFPIALFVVARLRFACLAFLYSAMQPMYGRLDYMKCDIW